LSVWPAVAAASFGWLVALVRLLVGHGRGENLDVDLVLAGGAALLIPLICVIFWLNARRAMQRRRPPSRELHGGRHLTLVRSGAARLRSAPAVHKENMPRTAC
jgi:hypothetical protein